MEGNDSVLEFLWLQMCVYHLLGATVEEEGGWCNSQEFWTRQQLSRCNLILNLVE